MASSSNGRSAHCIIVRYARKDSRTSTRWMCTIARTQVISTDQLFNVYEWMTWQSIYRWETICLLAVWQKLPSKSAFGQALPNAFGAKEFNHHERCVEAAAAAATAEYSSAAANRRDQWDRYAEINSWNCSNLRDVLCFVESDWVIDYTSKRIFI